MLKLCSEMFFAVAVLHHTARLALTTADPIGGSVAGQATAGDSEQAEATLRESATRLNQLSKDSPENLTIARDLVNTYHKLALHYQKNEQKNLAEQASNRARLAIQQSVGRLPLDALIDLLKQRDEWSVAAANRLGEMGAAATPAIPALSVALSENPQNGLQWVLPPAAGRALGRIGAASVPVLLKAVAGSQTSQRDIALEGLALVEQQPTEAARAIRGSIADPDPALRRSAVLALERLLGELAVLDDVVGRLNDADPSVRKAAVFVLGANGKNAVAAIPALIDTVDDKNPMVARAAIAAIGRVGADSEIAIRALTTLAADQNHSQRKCAISALGQLGPAAKVALPLVVAALADNDLAVQAVARQSLRRIDANLAAEKIGPPFDAVRENQLDRETLQVGPGDWPQWGGSRQRNNTPPGENIPAIWDVKTGKNIKWAVKLGSETYGNPVIANGRVFIGTNNTNGYLKRYPPAVDLGVLLCFDETTGEFLWQYSSPKLPTGRVHDWPMQGMPSTPVVDGQRLWATTNRGEVVCLDTKGFHDQENDGVFQEEANGSLDEADVLWRFDMLKELGVSPHNMSNCSILMVDGLLFVCTSNGVDEGHVKLPAPEAPSFIALNRDTGKVVWTDSAPGQNILHAQWASASYGILGGQPQILFPGGDGWLYSFDPRGDGHGHSKILWKFDCNPKDSMFRIGGRATRNSLIAFACIYDGLVYLAPGEDPEHGEGDGRLWCIDPSKKLDGSDVSADLVVELDGQIVPHRRLCAVDASQGERVIPNPDSAVVWQFSQFDRNADGAIDFEEQFHRSLGTAVIKDDVLYIADFSGLFHCLNAKTGDPYWSYDLFAASWGSALIVDGNVYIGDEDGDVAIFHHSGDPEATSRNGVPFAEINMETSIYSTPVVANNVLYIAARNMLYAIEGEQ